MNDWLAKKKDFLWFFIWTVSLVSAGDIQSERELQDALQFQFLCSALYCRIVCFTPYISSSNTLVLSHLRIYISWWHWSTVLENQSKSLILQQCERSDIHFWNFAPFLIAKVHPIQQLNLAKIWKISPMKAYFAHNVVKWDFLRFSNTM